MKHSLHSPFAFFINQSLSNGFIIIDKMKIPDKPIKDLTEKEQNEFFDSCRNYSELGTALTMLLNSDIVYTPDEVQAMIMEKMNQKDDSENTVEVTFLKKRP